MSLPDPASPAAVTLLQQAIGHVTVDGAIGPQTVAAVGKLDLGKFRQRWQGLLRAQFGSGDIAWIDAVIARAQSAPG